LKSSARGALRRYAPLALVGPLIVGVTLRSAHAVTPATAARWHERADAIVDELTNSLSGMRLFVAPATTPAKARADELRRARPEEARLLDRLAAQPTASWMGEWSGDVRRAVATITSAAQSSGTVPVLVAYNIPSRDCGEHSAGGERSAEGYRRWIRDFADGLGGRKAIVIVEPDGLLLTRCLTPAAEEERFATLRDAVGVLKAKGATVYLDAGNARWTSPAVAAERLRRASIDRADGFALNVSNFIPTDESMRFGDRLSALVKGKHYVIDTSRNGAAAPDAQWCNPRGRALGQLPTTTTGNALVDAFLWVKVPGESDGTCNGGPRAGQYWVDYALELARNQPARFGGAPRVASAARR
jgi:endoglucanase